MRARSLRRLQCLLHPNRNPDLTKREIEQHLIDEPGIDVVVWPSWSGPRRRHRRPRRQCGAFATGRPQKAGGAPTRPSPTGCGNVNRRWAAGTADVVRSSPRDRRDPGPAVRRGRWSARRGPTLNYYVGNGFVVVPVCGHPADAEMVAIIGDQYTGRVTVRSRSVPCSPTAAAGSTASRSRSLPSADDLRSLAVSRSVYLTAMGPPAASRSSPSVSSSTCRGGSAASGSSG